MTKDIKAEFQKVELDTDHTSVIMKIKEVEGEEIILHFSGNRVELLHQIQNNLYNTRQEYKQYIRKVKKEQEERDLIERRKFHSQSIEKQNEQIIKILDKNKKVEEKK